MSVNPGSTEPWRTMEGLTMRILIIDDSAANRKLAAEQLEGNELVFACSYDEGQAMLQPLIDEKKSNNRMDELTRVAGFSPEDVETYRNTEKWDPYWRARVAARKQAEVELTVPPRFDAVFSDLMLPASEQMLGGGAYRYIGQEMPLGTFLVLLAMRAGVKRVGLVTDVGHHDHPASAAIDAFHFRADIGAFDVGGTKIACWNRGKRWDLVLRLLNAEKPC